MNIYVTTLSKHRVKDLRNYMGRNHSTMKISILQPGVAKKDEDNTLIIGDSPQSLEIIKAWCHGCERGNSK